MTDYRKPSQIKFITVLSSTNLHQDEEGGAHGPIRDFFNFCSYFFFSSYFCYVCYCFNNFFFDGFFVDVLHVPLYFHNFFHLWTLHTHFLVVKMQITEWASNFFCPPSEILSKPLHSSSKLEDSFSGMNRIPHQSSGPRERMDRDIKVSTGLCLVVSTFGTLGIRLTKSLFTGTPQLQIWFGNGMVLSYPYPYHAPVNPTNLVAG